MQQWKCVVILKCCCSSLECDEEVPEGHAQDRVPSCAQDRPASELYCVATGAIQ
jgi:hypothetical protein